MQLDEESGTLSPLPEVLSHGLVAVSFFAFLSFFCSTSLLFYLTWRMISWKRKSGSGVQMNQFLFLVYNLLFADIQQSIAFLLNASALSKHAIVVESPTCFAQGWFVSTGDLSSSVFICAIAIHTFMSVVKEYRLPESLFYGWIGSLWAFIYLMAILGPAMHGRDFYVRASAWCWINDAYLKERLWLHYFWIFICIVSTLLIYAVIFITLRARAHTSKLGTSIHRATPMMVMYPLIYVVCTMPLAAGRVYALAGHTVTLRYFCVAGAMIACNGWLDVLLYAGTRASIVFSEEPPSEETGLETFAFLGKGHGMGTVTTIEAGGSTGRRLGLRGRSRESDSVEQLYGLDQIEIKGEVSVRVDMKESHGLAAEHGASRSWDATTGQSGLQEV